MLRGRSTGRDASRSVVTPFRSGRRVADPCAEMVGAKGLGHEARQAQWAPKGHSRRRAQAGGHSAPHVDRPNRVQLVEEGGCRVTSNNETKGFLQYGGKRCPCRDDGGGEIARFFASSQSERLRLQH